MECIVAYEGNEYRFCRDSKGKVYWVGHRRISGGSFIGPNCVAPLYLGGHLIKAAIDSGDYEKDFFFRKKKEVKAKRTRRAKSNNNSNSISIF